MAKTLGELERKLHELERTLTAIGHETRPDEATVTPSPSTPPSFGRLVDEMNERDEPARPVSAARDGQRGHGGKRGAGALR